MSLYKCVAIAKAKSKVAMKPYAEERIQLPLEAKNDIFGLCQSLMTSHFRTDLHIRYQESIEIQVRTVEGLYSKDEWGMLRALCQDFNSQMCNGNIINPHLKKCIIEVEALCPIDAVGCRINWRTSLLGNGKLPACPTDNKDGWNAVGWAVMPDVSQELLAILVTLRLVCQDRSAEFKRLNQIPAVKQRIVKQPIVVRVCREHNFGQACWSNTYHN